MGYRLDYMDGGGADPGALMASQQTRPARGMRDFLPEDVRRREYVIDVVRRRLRALRLRAARDAGAREHRDADRQVRRRRQQAHIQGAAPRRARVVGRDRPGAALRPDRAARARRRRASRQAAEVLQALPDSAGVARRPAGARPLPRVLPVRRRRDRIDVAGGRGGAVRRGQRRAAGARVHGLRRPAEPSRAADRRCSTRPACRPSVHGDALVALDKLDKIGRDGCRARAASAGSIPPAAAAMLVSAFARRRDHRAALRRSWSSAVAATRRLARRVGRWRRSSRWSAATSAGRAPAVRRSRLARGLSYYTGAIMEIAVPDLAGSLGGGGRYDGLIGMFLRRAHPGVRVLARPRADPRRDGRARHVPGASCSRRRPTCWSRCSTRRRSGEALRLAAELRAAGLRVEVYPEPDKLGKQFKYAAATGDPVRRGRRRRRDRAAARSRSRT